MSSAVTKLPKPNLYNVSRRAFYRDIWQSVAAGIVSGLLYHQFVSKKYERDVEEFFKTYDPFEDFERMRQLGIFQSAPPDWVLEERAKKQKEKEKRRGKN